MSHRVCVTKILWPRLFTRGVWGQTTRRLYQSLVPASQSVVYYCNYPINTRVNKHIPRGRISECDRIVMMGCCLWCGVMLSRSHGETDRYPGSCHASQQLDISKQRPRPVITFLTLKRPDLWTLEAEIRTKNLIDWYIFKIGWKSIYDHTQQLIRRTGRSTIYKDFSRCRTYKLFVCLRS